MSFLQYSAIALSAWAVSNSVLAGIMSVTAIWLVIETLKKNDYYTRHYLAMPDYQLTHEWRGAEEEQKDPGMSNIAFFSNGPFSLLVGIWIEVPFTEVMWFHTYGWVTSDASHRVVIRTWLGKNPGTFVYMSSVPAERVTILRTDSVQKLTPDVTHEPHWYQRWLHIFG